MNLSEKEIQEQLENIRVFEKEMNKNPDPEHAKRVRKMMMDTSPKTKPPKKLFHASKLENHESIMEKGILAHKLFGQIYFCDTKEAALLFVPKPCYIYEVDPKMLLPKRFRISLDHNKKHFPVEAYAYYGDVPVEAITKSYKEL